MLARPRRTARAALGPGVEEAAVLDRPWRAQDSLPRAFRDTVLGVVAKAAQGHAALDRLGVRRYQRIDAAAFEPVIYRAIGVAGIGRDRLDRAARGPLDLAHLALDGIAIIGLPRCDLKAEDHAFQAINGGVLLETGLEPPVPGRRRHRRIRIGLAHLLVLAALSTLLLRLESPPRPGFP